MYQPKFEAFDASQPLLPGISDITLAEALTCEQLLVTLDPAPSAEVSGETLLVSTDFRRVKNAHLEANRVRFLDQPRDKDGMLGRINWMWHAGSRSPVEAAAERVEEAIELMVAQVAPDCEFDTSKLAGCLASVEVDHPAITAALFIGDLDDVPDLIDAAVESGGDEQTLVRAAAWMFVSWGALEQQREACHGHRLIHYPLDGIWGADGGASWTIGQLFRPNARRHKFAHEMRDLYHANQLAGVEKVNDKRTLNRIERTLSRMDLSGINRANEKEILALFGQGRAASLPARLDAVADYADAFQRRYEAVLAGPDGSGRAGQRTDMLSARISAVHRVAIVCARTYLLASLAKNASSTDDLRKMLDTRLPEVLRPKTDRQVDWDKFRLRQLFHVIRVEFLQDGEHLPKRLKGAVNPKHPKLDLELHRTNTRRGHELFDHCWAVLNDQPVDWRFITPFGWQCDGTRRVHLSAPVGANPTPVGCSREAADQFAIEREHAARARRAVAGVAPLAGSNLAAVSSNSFMAAD